MKTILMFFCLSIASTYMIGQVNFVTSEYIGLTGETTITLCVVKDSNNVVDEKWDKYIPEYLKEIVYTVDYSDYSEFEQFLRIIKRKGSEKKRKKSDLELLLFTNQIELKRVFLHSARLKKYLNRRRYQDNQLFRRYVIRYCGDAHST